MYILGDIGNSETKVYLVNSRYNIVGNISFLSKKLNNKILNQKFKHLVRYFKLIKKILFCIVVPKSFSLIKNFLSIKTKYKFYYVKDLILRSFINI